MVGSKMKVEKSVKNRGKLRKEGGLFKFLHQTSKANRAHYLQFNPSLIFYQNKNREEPMGWKVVFHNVVGDLVSLGYDPQFQFFGVGIETTTFTFCIQVCKNFQVAFVEYKLVVIFPQSFL